MLASLLTAGGIQQSALQVRLLWPPRIGNCNCVEIHRMFGMILLEPRMQKFSIRLHLKVGQGQAQFDGFYRKVPILHRVTCHSCQPLTLTLAQFSLSSLKFRAEPTTDQRSAGKATRPVRTNTATNTAATTRRRKSSTHPRPSGDELRPTA